MAQVFGDKWTRRDLLKYGEFANFAGLERTVLDDGLGRGMRVASLRTGTGLEAEILIDRCLDLGRAAFNGAPLAFRTFNGPAHPSYYNPAGIEWVRTFGGGMLATCGLSNVGAPCNDNGEELGLHGRIANTPASDVSVSSEWRRDELHFAVSGTMREGMLFGPHLVLRRTVSSSLGANCIEIQDTITNKGFTEAPLMLLYHFNAGFPLVADGSRLLAASGKVTPRDGEAEKGIAAHALFEAPQAGYKEQVFYHEMLADADDRVRVGIVSPKKDCALLLEYPKQALPQFTQWKMMGQGCYVVGLEPANCHVGGRAAERKAGTLQILKAGEEKSVSIKLAVLSESQEISKLERELKALKR